jgi:hemerythrin superfamily protein
MKVLCPKCRALGLHTDCTEQLKDAGTRMKPTEAPYELEVTLRFSVAVTSTLTYDPTEMAMHMRDRWADDEKELEGVVTEGLWGEYDLQVRPAFYQ